MIFGFIQHILNTLDNGNFSILERGISIGVLGISVVFMGLIILFIFMKLFIFASQYSEIKKENKTAVQAISKLIKTEPMTGEIATAISMAIHQSREEFHDMEETIITLQRITKPYSPWSSKIHILRRSAR